MNKHLEKIINDSRDIKNQTWIWYKELSRPKQVGVAIIGVLILVVIGRSLSGGAVAEELVKAPRTVSLALVSDLSNNESALPLLGTVTSRSEATIRSESSGKLTRVYKKLGDYVGAGAVIAEFENSGERAAVLQAEGSYDAAKAARDIARINSGTTGSSLLETKNAALNTINSAYVTMEDVIRIKTDSAYTDPRENEVHFNVLVPDTILTLSLEAKRKEIENILINRGAKNRTLTVSSDLTGELNAVQSEVQTIKTYLDDLATAYSKALEDTNYSLAEIAAAKANISSARSAIGVTLSSITQSRSAITSALAAQEVAGKTSSNVDTSVTTADAQVKQAQGAYNAALSRLEKTVIRSPINGTLNSLSIETGDFVSAFTEVAVVSNNGALEVLAYVTEEDAKRITVGSPVMIDAAVKGVVTRIASAIDPRTKKIEVRVGITDKASTLVNGQSVRIDVSRATVKAITSGPIKIPLSALKLTPNGAFVFTTSATSSLIAIKVSEGAILGEEIQILSGLTGSESIVIDARGLKEGMIVTIKE
jgi:RND family efflux transporter MFP subunit